MIDNYDSFVFNIYQYILELSDEEVRYFRNDEITLQQVRELAPSHIILSPGPNHPKDSGICLEILRADLDVPILGVCLGHQTIGEAFGGKVVRANTLMHGKTSPVFHENSGVFKGLPNPVVCTRYHSLVIDRASLPEHLHITAWTEDGTIMGIRHRDYAIEGVQFHPEGLLTEHGHEMLKNFLDEFAA